MAGAYGKFTILGMAIDPVHVGTGGARLGRVDLSIVRDPVTRVPKIPGSSLAGVCRSYAAMAQQEKHPNRQLDGQAKPYFPDCAGQGQPDKTGKGGHCGQADCPICTVFGFARGSGGGFAGLAAFSDAHVLLFPVATREGPVWITCPDALRRIGHDIQAELGDAVYRQARSAHELNLGWLLLEVKQLESWDALQNVLKQRLVVEKTWQFIAPKVTVVSDKLFSHIVNSNLEVRTSVSINPETGAAEEGALFSYEALPRATVLVWDVVCKNPQHFQVGGSRVSAQVNGQAIDAPAKVVEVVKFAHPYLEHLGIGGMGTRGMGRIRVLSCEPAAMGQQAQATHAGQDRASAKTT